MTDITKCSGANCDLKLTCYRYTSPSSATKSTFLLPPIVDGKCEMYWNTRPTILDDINVLVEEMTCDECGGFVYHKMSCSFVK